MCGILGIISKNSFSVRSAVKRLKRLEYRGYDSFGFFCKKKLVKDIGHIKLPETRDEAKKIILHTRWSTHGGVTKNNAHPHLSCNKKIAIVHNGIISNYLGLKKSLIKKGHKFISETDSEVIAHYIEEKIKTEPMAKICKDFMTDIEGEFAVVVMIEGENKLYALKRGSPLVLGLCKDKNIVASDIYAFSDLTNKAIFFEDNEFAVIYEDSYEFYNKNGKKQKKQPKNFLWDYHESELKHYKHYMIKEIMEAPNAAKRLLFSLEEDQKQGFMKLIRLIKSSSKITFVAAGTSYHASLLGVYYLHKCGINAQTIIASEFKHFIGVDNKTLVIAISQSGETMDVIEALKFAKSHGAKIASIVNVPYSTVQRMSDISLNILAGQEICVAATKSFVNQVALLLAVSKELGFKVNLKNLPERITELFKEKEKIKKIASKIYKHKDIYVLGRGLSYPVAREIALKIKEISYIHAEGMMGGELKHGTIALIEKGTPVIGIVSGKDNDMLSNLKEVESRGAYVIKIANEFDADLKIKTSNDGKFGILAAIAGQLLTYYMADLLNLPIDKPRNLAKSVTVK